MANRACFSGDKFSNSARISGGIIIWIRRYLILNENGKALLGKLGLEGTAAEKKSASTGEKIRSGRQFCALGIKKPGSQGQVCANPRDTQTDPTFSRAGLGAGKQKFLELPPRVKQGGARFRHDWRHIDIPSRRVHLGSEFAACWQEPCLSGSPDATANSILFFGTRKRRVRA